MSPRVLLTDNDLGDRRMETQMLRDALDAEVIVADCTTAGDVIREIDRVAPDAIVTQWAPIDAAVIAKASDRCRLISRIGIGVDMIDLQAAAQAGIEVRNVPHYCTEEVATHAVAMALALWRRLPQLDAELRSGVWAAAAHAGHISRLSEATVGLIGCGRIGHLVAKAFEAWGARIIVVDPAPADDGYERVDLGEIAARADIISLHAPLIPQTRHVINGDFIAASDRRPIIVNTSRGALVDADAAVDALVDGRLGGLGLDVFETEPLPMDAPVRSAPSTILTPHAAWCSADALPELRRGAIQNVIDVLGRAATVATENEINRRQ